MLLVLAILVGFLFAVGFFLMLRRSTIDLVFGLIMLSHGANLLVFAAAGSRRGAPPLLRHAVGDIADPLPQALVLTAIVIGFGVVAFAMVLVARLYWQTGDEDSDRLGEADS